MKKIEFWYSIGSTYTYLSTQRLEQLEANNDVIFEWFPFSVRARMIEMENVPFMAEKKRQKIDYMWRDVQRRAKLYGFDAKTPAPYPLKEFDLANKIAMHITAMKPLALDEKSLDTSFIEKEREIYTSQLKASGKPENIIDKIVDGKLKKYLSEVTLINQNWVLEPSLTLDQVLKDFNSNNNDDLSIIDFKLLVLGEGIEVEEKSFSEEVASQVNNTT